MGKHVYKSKPLDAFDNAHYDEEERNTWTFLLNRQNELIKGRASKEFIKGVELLGFTENPPQQKEVSSILMKHTGWKVAPVPALIQTQHFFDLLSSRQFPAANFIRVPEELDYIEEPDLFHEIYGHCPLLTNEAYAEFMYSFGKIASVADPKIQRRLFRLFWFTIEFGLIKEDGNIRAYGGGILSSKSEIIYSVESEIPERRDLDPLDALRTPFRIDILQPVYFVINNYDELFKLITKDLVSMAKRSFEMEDFPAKFEKKFKDKVSTKEVSYE